MFVEHADQLGERLGVVRVAKNEAIYPIVQRCPAVEYNPFPDVGGCAKLPWFRKGFAAHSKSPHWCRFVWRP